MATNEFLNIYHQAITSLEDNSGEADRNFLRFAEAFVDRINETQNGEIWKSPSQVSMAFKPYDKLPNGTFITCRPIPAVNMVLGFDHTILTFTESFDKPVIAAIVVIETRTDRNNKNVAFKYSFSGNEALGFDKKTIYDLMAAFVVNIEK